MVSRWPFLFLVFWLLGAATLGFILVPLLALVAAPGLAGLVQAAAMPDVRQAIALSLEAAILTAILAGVSGVPLAYVLSRRVFMGKKIIEALVDLPLAVPHTVAGIALLLAFSRHGFLGEPAAAWFGLRFWGTFAGIVVGMLFVSLPYTVNAARIGFEAIDVHLEKVARTLGAGPWKVFAQVTLPLAWRGVIGGLTLTFARAISEFATVALLAYYPMTAPIKVYELFLRYGLDAAVGAAVLFLAVVLALFLLLRYFAYGGGAGRGFGR